MNSFYFYLRLAHEEYRKASFKMMPIYLNSKKEMALGCLGVSLTFIKCYAQLGSVVTDKVIFLDQRIFINLNSKYKINGLAKKNLTKLYNEFKIAFDPDVLDQNGNIYDYFERVKDVLDKDIPSSILGGSMKYNVYLCELARELAIENYKVYKEKYN